MKTKYKQIGEFFFEEGTDEQVANVVNRMYQTKKRYKVYFGCVDTGKVYAEEYDTIGTVGKSTGQIKIPLMITRKGNMGGGALLPSLIVAVREMDTNYFIYKHSKFVEPTVEIKENTSPDPSLKEYKFETYFNGELHGRHKSLRSAQICRSKLK